MVYALRWTQHSTGVQMIGAAAIIQLLISDAGFDVGPDLGESRERLDYRIMNPLVCVRPALAAYRDVNQIGLDPAQRRFADGEPLGDARRMVLHEEIGARDHPLEQLEPARIAQVNRGRTLVAIDHGERRSDAAPRAANRAREIADSRRLDLD